MKEFLEKFQDLTFVDDSSSVTRNFFLGNTIDKAKYILDPEDIRKEWYYTCCKPK